MLPRASRTNGTVRSRSAVCNHHSLGARRAANKSTVVIRHCPVLTSVVRRQETSLVTRTRDCFPDVASAKESLAGGNGTSLQVSLAAQMRLGSSVGAVVDVVLEPDEVRTAEVIGSFCLATDLAMGFPFEHGLQSTLVAMRLAERMGVEPAAANQTYYGCLLAFAGCTTDAEIASAVFANGALLKYFHPVMFGSPAETLVGIMKALAGPDSTPLVRAMRGAVRLPGAVRGHQRHIVAMCEVAEMLCDRLGMPRDVHDIVLGFTARWDGKGTPRGLGGEQLPVALRIMHVARDATFQCLLGGTDHVLRVMRDRSGKAFDPDVVTHLTESLPNILAFDDSSSVWAEMLAWEPQEMLMLRGDEVDRALAAMGDFADLISSYFIGHSAAVAQLAAAAAARLDLAPRDVVAVRRAALVHDVGRVAVGTSVWNKPAALTADEWEHVRLHAYHTERVLSRSPALSKLGSIAGAHHERLDGSGYHRGVTAPSLAMTARLLAVADAYRTMIEPRPHRAAKSPEEAARALAEAASAGRIDPDAVAAVLEAAGTAVPRMARPAGLTGREAQVISMVAKGLQTKQVGHRLGISAKTADRHLQNAYAKIGVSTRAAAALFAMQHGLTSWGELPIPDTSHGS
jgi:HD-GYP domain-containing protein (c-di-GMP phosphodiesterase class II)